MIDCHCHIEQKDYNEDRDEVIEKCMKELKCVISSCAHYNDIQLTLDLIKKYPNFVFTCFSLHPEYIQDITREQIEELKGILRDEVKKKQNKNIVAIGETGLDYHWIKDPILRERQLKLFEEFIELSNELNLPLVVHSRESVDECITVLEKHNCKKVLMHLFSGNLETLNRVVKNDWYITIGPGIKNSKSYKKFARRIPINRFMLETDAPWWGFGKRNDPTAVKIVAEVIGQERGLTTKEIEKQTDLNAKEFFNLSITI